MIFCHEHDCISNVAGTCGVPNPEIYLHGMERHCNSHHKKDESSAVEERILKGHRLKVAGLRS